MASKTYTLEFDHEIAITKGFKRNPDGSYVKDDKGEKTPIIIRTDLPAAAADRQFKIQVIEVPEGIPESIMRMAIDKYIYGHGSYVNSTLFDVKTIQIGEVVTLKYTDILEWCDTVGAPPSGDNVRRRKLYNQWKAGKLSKEDREALDPEDREWMLAHHKKELAKLTEMVAE